MADEETTETTEQSTETEPQPAPAPPPPLPPTSSGGEHRLEELERFRAEYRRELEQRDNKTAEEIRQLREDLDKANAYIAEQKKALKMRDDARKDGGTIVVPPDAIARPSTQSQQGATDNDASQATRKRRMNWW